MIPGLPIHIVGIGTTPLSKRSEQSDEDLVVAAVSAALADAGIGHERMTGLNVQSHHDPGPDVAAIVRTLGADSVSWAPTGGIGVPGMTRAIRAIAADRADVIVVCKVMNTATALNRPTVDENNRKVSGRDQFELPYGLGYTVQRAALVQRRWMSSRAVTPEQLGMLCSVQRDHALLNDNAIFKTPLSLDDYLAGRTICDPIRLFDCDMPINGAYAYVLSSNPDPAAPQRAVRVLASTDGDGDAMPHIRPEGVGVRSDVARIYAELGIGPDSLTALMLYDGFSYLVPQWMEALGIVEPEDVGAYIGDAANIRFDGATPVNTHGGQLSEGRMHGAGHIVEAVRQLRGEGGARQIARPSRAAVTTAFPATGGVAILEANR
jgi:acetyl-CoA acetyltransferase